MNQELPKWLQVTLVIVLVALGLMMFLQRDRLHVYSRYMREKSPEINMRFAELSHDMDEAAVRKHYEGAGLQCASEGGSLGDRVCYASIDRADGMAAMTLATFFVKGKLVRALVQMPWWSHGTWQKALKAQYGLYQYAGTVGAMQGPVLRWTIPNGSLETNRNRGINPLSPSVVIWTASEAK